MPLESRHVALRDGFLAMSTAYLFDQASGQQLLQLGFSGPETAWMDDFGAALAVDGDLVAIGAPWDDDDSVSSGTAYAYDALSGELQQEWHSPGTDAFWNFNFGRSVAVAHGLFLIGDPGDDVTAVNDGSVWIFDAATDNLSGQLVASNTGNHDFFGTSLAASAGLAVSGAPFFGSADKGAAYAFDLNTGDLLFRLLDSTPHEEGRLGSSVAVEGTLALVGAPHLGDSAGPPGAALLFDLTTGALLRELTAPDTGPGDAFGASVALLGGRAIVGAPLADTIEADTGRSTCSTPRPATSSRSSRPR